MAVRGEGHANGFGGRRSGATEAKEGGDFILDLLEFVEVKFGVANEVQVAGFLVLIEAHDAVFGMFDGGFGELPFAFEHDGEDVACGFGVGFVLFDESLEEGEGAFFAGDVGFFFGDDLLEGGFPVGVRGALGELFVPGVEGDVTTEVAACVGVEVDGGDHGLAVIEGEIGLGAGVSAGADVPILEHGGGLRIAECGGEELGGGGGGVAVAGAGDFGGFEGEFGEFLVLRAEVEEEATEEAEGEVGDPCGEGGVEMAAFAKGEEDVIDENHAEEDEDGAGDATDGAAAGVGDAEGGGDEGKDDALEGEGEAMVEVSYGRGSAWRCWYFRGLSGRRRGRERP